MVCPMVQKQAREERERERNKQSSYYQSNKWLHVDEPHTIPPEAVYIGIWAPFWCGTYFYFSTEADDVRIIISTAFLLKSSTSPDPQTGRKESKTYFPLRLFFKALPSAEVTEPPKHWAQAITFQSRINAK